MITTSRNAQLNEVRRDDKERLVENHESTREQLAGGIHDGPIPWKIHPQKNPSSLGFLKSST